MAVGGSHGDWELKDSSCVQTEMHGALNVSAEAPAWPVAC